MKEFWDSVVEALGVAPFVVLSVATVLAVLILLVGALAELQDSVVEAGWFGGVTGRLGRQYRRRRITKIIPVLESVGLDAAAQRAIREAARQPKKNDRVAVRPDLAFLRRSSRWIRELEQPTHSYHGSAFYLDLMGAIDGREDHEVGIDQIFQSWIERLQHEAVIIRPDLVIALKDGNVLLCRQVAELLQTPLVLCKGERDRSRVVGTSGSSVHETDFEGLRAYCDREVQLLPGYESREFRALLIDDSCKNGTQLQSAAKRFNRLISSSDSGLALKFQPVDSAVVLFRSLATKVSDEGLRGAGIQLHSLVSVGDSELSKLKTRKNVSLSDVPGYKRDSSCSESRRLFGDDAVDQRAARQRKRRLPPKERVADISEVPEAESPLRA